MSVRRLSDVVRASLSARLDRLSYPHRHLLPGPIRQRLLQRRFTPATDLVSARTLAVARRLVFPAQRVRLHDIQVHSNLGTGGTADWAHAYRPRQAMVQDISILRLPRGACVSGALGFAVMADGFMVAEQQVAVDAATLPHLAYAFRANEPSVRITEDAMLVARYGEGTWGHWLGELLPKIVVCERLAPGRFRYVMADYVLEDAVLGSRIRESCAAYGVSESRFIRVPSGEQYSFDRLYAMTPVITEGAMHPEVKRVLNEPFGDPAERGIFPRRLNLLRSDGRRSIVNADAVNADLASRGFVSVDIAALPFRDQVAAFRGAAALFSVLGSGLTGLVYSAAELRVAAAAPAEWGDDFFYGLLRTDPAARWAEVRGPIVERHPGHLRFSSFRVDRNELAEALDSLGL